jgi:hypothetical protein
MKNMLVYIIGALVLLVVVFLIYRNNIVKKQATELAAQRSERIQPLLAKLKNNATGDDVNPFAYALATREETYLLLKEFNRLDLFPKDLMTIEKAAEANLAVWLEFPTELGAIPDEIEHVERVTIPVDAENNVYYHVFKYRVNEPHWAAQDGWMLGVAGPYFDDSQPYDFPAATFARVDSKFGVISPEEEAKWVHENIGLERIKGE